MKTITLIAVVAMVAAAFGGPTSSVGGPMTLMLIVFLVMLAVGIYEACLNRRSGLGWIVNIAAALVGGFVAVIFASMAMEAMLGLLHFEGSLASSHHPLLFVAAAGMAILTVQGSWLTLQVVNRLR